MRLTHWAKNDNWRYDPNRSYVQPDSHDPIQHPEGCYGMKPVGWWLSDDSKGRGWYDWAKAENYWSNIYQVAVPEVNENRLLILDDVSSVKTVNELLEEQNGCWQWGYIAKKYAGCLFYAADAQHAFHDLPEMRLMWLRTWDCNSACVWDLTAVSL